MYQFTVQQVTFKSGGVNFLHHQLYDFSTYKEQSIGEPYKVLCVKNSVFQC